MSEGEKKAGCCTMCDAEVFECMARYQEGEARPGEMKRIGKPKDDAVRATFLLESGEVMDLTFCRDCYEGLDEVDYMEIWNKVLRSWVGELGDGRPDWFGAQMENGIMCELGCRDWKEVMADAH